MKEQGGELQVEGSVCGKPWRSQCGFKNKGRDGWGRRGRRGQVTGVGDEEGQGED